MTLKTILEAFNPRVKGHTLNTLLVFEKIGWFSPEPVFQTDLVLNLELSKSIVSDQLKLLDELGYIVKETNPYNRREQLIKLSDSGLDLWNQIT